MIRSLRQRITGSITTRLRTAVGAADEITRIRQQLRYLAVPRLIEPGIASIDLTPYECSLYSQNGEDGVLAEIFRRVGDGGRRFLEVGAYCNESNCLALADVFSWGGLFCDADPNRVAALERRYQTRSDLSAKCVYVTPENIADLIHTVAGDGGVELDLLSLDVDGDDFWIWAAVKQYPPRVVLVEFNSSLGGRLVQAPGGLPWDGSRNFGASLGAFQELAQRRGYRLVYVDLAGANAFFVREDQGAPDGFLGADDVVLRGPNYFLSGMQHPSATPSRGFVDPFHSGALLGE